MDGQEPVAAHFEAIEKYNEAREAFWLTTAVRFETIGNFDKAHEAYGRALKDSLSATALLSGARLAIYVDRIDEAKAWVDRVLSADGGNGQAWILQGAISIHRGQSKQAYDSYQKALSTLPADAIRNAALWFGIGVMYEEHSNWNLAKQAYTAVLQLVSAGDFEALPDVLLRTAFVCIHLNELDEALGYLTRVLATPPAEMAAEDVALAVARVHGLKNDWPRAQALYEHILTSMCPSHVGALQDLAALHQRMVAPESAAAAEELLARALSLEPKNVVTMCLVARGKAANGPNGRPRDLPGAFEAARVALRLAPDAAPIWAFLGTLYFRTGNVLSSFECYAAALLRAPACAELHWNMGVLYSVSGQAADAAAAFAEAVRLNPSLPQSEGESS